jgi:tol-pal system protein YbgF
MMRNSLTVAALLLLLWPSAAGGQNREHLQMNADLRMLQEHVNRLQLSANRLDEQLETTNARLEAVTAASVKGFADQQLLINQLTSTLGSVRERLDDNSVRVSQLSQEFTAIREGVRRLTEQINTLIGLLQPTDPTAKPSAALPPAPPPAAAANTDAAADGETEDATPPTLEPVIFPQSASRIYAQAFGDYMARRYDNAIAGFRELIEQHPSAPDAANAQLQIGESFNQKNDCRSAIPEYQKFVDTYPESDRRHEGLFMLGWCYNDLNQRADAQAAYEQVIKEYPSSPSAHQAMQRLQGMGIKP